MELRDLGRYSSSKKLFSFIYAGLILFSINFFASLMRSAFSEVVKILSSASKKTFKYGFDSMSDDVMD